MRAQLQKAVQDLTSLTRHVEQELQGLASLRNGAAAWAVALGVDTTTLEMASDAYATGQAIYALVSRGGIDRSDPAIVRARDFLLKTQKPDGSWPMTSRPPNSGAGKRGAGNLEPITVAGSAWAVLGLLQRTPPPPALLPSSRRPLPRGPALQLPGISEESGVQAVLPEVPIPPRP
ncbi:MAG: hypothetical protein HYS12_09975 [Planctomycetes bacterium]|nr:hypothetical protein [Planctomycetota bacterium]